MIMRIVCIDKLNKILRSVSRNVRSKSLNGRSVTRNVRSVTRNGDLMALQKHLHGIARTFAWEINKRCKCIYSEFCCNFVED